MVPTAWLQLSFTEGQGGMERYREVSRRSFSCQFLPAASCRHMHLSSIHALP